MSGHSKWSQIKHKKALTDAKKGKVFSKIAAQISLAAKHGKDPAMNPNLRVYLDKARQAGMPKENIERAIKRGNGEQGGAMLEEVIYEAYGPAGVGIIIEAVTDNKNRTLAQVKSIFNKFSGKLADAGSVSYQFEKQGVINFNKAGESTEELSLAVIDAGAKDIIESDDIVTIYTNPSDFETVKKIIEQSGIVVESSEIALEPKQTIPLEEIQKQAVVKLLEALDELEDVTNISTNAEI